MSGEPFFFGSSQVNDLIELFGKYSSILSADEIEITTKAVDEAKDIVRTNVLDIIAAVMGIDPIPPLLSMLEKDSAYLSLLVDWVNLYLLDSF